MGLATTGGAEVEGESQVKKSRRAIGTGGRLMPSVIFLPHLDQCFVMTSSGYATGPCPPAPGP